MTGQKMKLVLLVNKIFAVSD